MTADTITHKEAIEALVMLGRPQEARAIELAAGSIERGRTAVAAGAMVVFPRVTFFEWLDALPVNQPGKRGRPVGFSPTRGAEDYMPHLGHETETGLLEELPDDRNLLTFDYARQMLEMAGMPLSRAEINSKFDANFGPKAYRFNGVLKRRNGEKLYRCADVANWQSDRMKKMREPKAVTQPKSYADMRSGESVRVTDKTLEAAQVQFTNIGKALNMRFDVVKVADGVQVTCTKAR